MNTAPTDPEIGIARGASIDDAVAELETLAELPVADHPAVFESIHRVLRDHLAGTPDVRA